MHYTIIVIISIISVIQSGPASVVLHDAPLPWRINKSFLCQIRTENWSRESRAHSKDSVVCVVNMRESSSNYAKKNPPRQHKEKKSTHSWMEGHHRKKGHDSGRLLSEIVENEIEYKLQDLRPERTRAREREESVAMGARRERFSPETRISIPFLYFVHLFSHLSVLPNAVHGNHHVQEEANKVKTKKKSQPAV